MSQEKVLCSSHTDYEIKGFFGQYRWLSNYHLCPVMYDGDIYPSSENAYQAAKFLRQDRTEFIISTPNDARKLGKSRKLDALSLAMWDDQRLHVMYQVLLDKFTRNKDLAKALLDTGDKYLEETNWWNDTFWGVCNGQGTNHLGKVLMSIRTYLNAHLQQL